MITDPQKCKTYYQALIDRDANYDGIFYAGITTTGISVMQHALQESLKLKTVYFLLPQNQHC